MDNRSEDRLECDVDSAACTAAKENYCDEHTTDVKSLEEDYKDNLSKSPTSNISCNNEAIDHDRQDPVCVMQEEGQPIQADEPLVFGQALYSTERFKIRIDNLNPWASHTQIKQKMISLSLKPKKVKKMGKSSYAFATFGNEEDRALALSVLQGKEWKGKVLQVKMAEAVNDPMQSRKRQADKAHLEGHKAEKQMKLSLDEYKSSLMDKVTPLWRMSYEEQLQQKELNLKKILQTLSHELMAAYRSAGFAKSMFPNTQFDGLLLPIKPSPQVEGYRNKCEFTVGLHPLTNERTVGFRLGEYRQGTVSVLEPTDCLHVSNVMKEVAQCFQNYVRTSAYPPYDPVTQQGHWMWLLVRTSRSKQIMLMPSFVRHQLTQEQIDVVKADLKTTFIETIKAVGVSSLYVNIVPLQQRYSDECTNPEHLWGDLTAEEELLGLKFQISPMAFFQVNTLGAEILYSSIAEFASLSNECSILLDICCGTGTIGMLLAKHAKQVIGIELVPQAVKDAEENAKRNSVDNITFKCGKAETVLPEIMKTIEHDSPVAIVDPPRAGLNREVMQALRRTGSLSKLIYVACEPQYAIKNMVDLMRPASKRWKGRPFKLVKALPVDMFPYTDKCELVLLFEREPAAAIDDSD